MKREESKAIAAKKLPGRTAQNFWSLFTQIVLAFLQIWVWILAFKIWVLGGFLVVSLEMV